MDLGFAEFITNFRSVKNNRNPNLEVAFLIKIVVYRFCPLCFSRCFLFDYARQQPNQRLPVYINMMMDEYCNIDLLDSKKIWSVACFRNINIQAATQGIIQLSMRYPHNEWPEILSDADN